MRKRKLTPEEKAEILTLLTIGCSRSTAARHIRRAPSTLRREILEDKKFAEQVSRAETSMEVFCLTRLRQAAGKDQHWRAALGFLERRLPDRFANKKPETLTPEHVQKFMTTCMNIITEKVPNKKLRGEILHRLAEELE